MRGGSPGIGFGRAAQRRCAARQAPRPAFFDARARTCAVVPAGSSSGSSLVWRRVKLKVLFGILPRTCCLGRRGASLRGGGARGEPAARTRAMLAGLRRRGSRRRAAQSGRRASRRGAGGPAGSCREATPHPPGPGRGPPRAARRRRPACRRGGCARCRRSRRLPGGGGGGETGRRGGRGGVRAGQVGWRGPGLVGGLGLWRLPRAARRAGGGGLSWELPDEERAAAARWRVHGRGQRGCADPRRRACARMRGSGWVHGSGGAARPRRLSEL
jgi:hypothetical protein